MYLLLRAGLNMRLPLHLFSGLAIVMSGCLLLTGKPPVLPVPVFTVSGPDAKPMQVRTADNRATLVVFVSALCPISTDYGPRLESLEQAFSSQGVRMLLVNSNQNESDSQVETQRKLSKIEMPVYRDPQGRLADILGANATPSAMILDQAGSLRYAGAIDDSRNPTRVRKPYVRLAMEEILAGKSVTLARTSARGCSIKSSNP
jgi:glutathione peroxidase-family protein